MADIEVPVLIVGAGACGLTSSSLLSDLGVASYLVERHDGTSHLPKAHYLNQRTMEVLRQHGIADSVYAVGSPVELMRKVLFRTSLGGRGPLDGKTIHEWDAFGGGPLEARYLADSPCPSTNYPQLRFEPLLRKHAESRKAGTLRFGHELRSLEQDGIGVTATIRDLHAARDYTVRAQYVIGADGGKTIGPMLGVQMQGPTGLMDMVSTHFTADLSEWWPDGALIAFFANPEGEGTWSSGAMAQMGPTWGSRSEEWVLHFMFRPDDPARMDETAIVPRIRELLRIPDTEIVAHKVSHWILEGVLAEKYRVGRVFLAGDAAHRHPPTTGLGMNTAIQDAHNLVWKVAAVLRGTADPSLLDTYEAERQPIGMRNVDWAMFTFLNHIVLDAGVGLIPGAPREQNIAAYLALFDDSPMGETRRARARVVCATQNTEFQAHDLEIGFRYDRGALVPDGSEPPPRDPLGSVHYPTTRPGHRLPHAWLEKSGSRTSTLDFAGASQRFVLFTGNKGGVWANACAAEAKAAGVELTVVAIGVDYADPTGRWAQVSEIGEDGAVLVRPDNHVAWRSKTAAKNADEVLRDAFRGILGRGGKA